MVDDLKIPDMDQGLMPDCVEALKYFKKHASEGIRICPPFEQSSITIAFLLRGPKLYTDFYEKPNQVHKLLDVCTETFIITEKYLKGIVGEKLTEKVTWRGTYISGLRVAGDYSMNLSPNMLEEFDIPYLKRIASVFGGKLLLHFCSTRELPGDQVMETFARCKEIVGIDSQLNVMNHYSKNAVNFEGNLAVVTTIEHDGINDFQEKAKDILKNFKSHIGLIVITAARDIAEAQAMSNVWRDSHEYVNSH